MSVLITIQLNDIGENYGDTFEVFYKNFYNDIFVSLGEVTGIQLVAGWDTAVPENTSIIRVVAKGSICRNYIDLLMPEACGRPPDPTPQ